MASLQRLARLRRDKTIMPGACLIGNSGFVGGNLARQYSFDDCYNSRNIEQIRGRSYDLLVCCGVSAVKWHANRFPAEDRARIDRLLKQLSYVRATRAILISTVDVYPSTKGVDESFDPHGHSNHPYGINRLHVEDTIREFFGSAHVVRLPALFGPGLKKNVIYDLLHDNCLDAIHPHGSFQYYDVRRLWRDLQTVTGNNLSVVNFATGPIETSEIVRRYFPAKQIVSEAATPPGYDMRTKYADHFNGGGGYIYRSEEVLADMGDWIQKEERGVAA
jgi:nucleoside-diphosphate-sugar epimerase